jgi:hypothetical protein
LVAYGAQDVYLTGNPQVTLFKVVYRRITNFSSECIELPIDLAKPGGLVSTQVQRNADLMAKSYLRMTVPDLIPTNTNFNGDIAWVRRLGHALISYVEITIGGSSIDKHYGTWLDIWYELTHTVSLERGYEIMIGDIPELTTLTPAEDGVTGGQNIYLPFQFWFCRNYGLSLPLIALQYHDVRINIQFEAIGNLVVYTAGSGSDSAPKFNGLTFGSSGILIEYIYLDSEERRRFAQVGHEYLIEQIQLNQQNLLNGAQTQQFTLNFNHPCKELIWAQQCGNFNGTNGSTFLAYTGDGDWATAVQDAANNIARSMIALTADTIHSGSTTTINVTTTDTVFSDSSIAGSTVFRFTVVQAPHANTSFTMVNNPLVLGGVNLATLLGTVSVDLYFDVSGTDLLTANVSVAGYTLSLYDLSIPIQSMTDNRVIAHTGSYKAADTAVVQVENYGVLLNGRGNMVTTGKIILNGHDRFSLQTGTFFNYLEPNARHTRTPADGINVYSFGLHPEQHQPTGTCNMSRIDSAILYYQVADPYASKRDGVFDIYTGTVVYIFVQNYNVLRIMSGMAGVAYSN